MMCADSTYSNPDCDLQYFVAINVSSSYQQVGGTRYRLMNVNRYWYISTLNEIYYRRFQLRNCAMELFFTDNTSWLFQFFDNKRRDKVFKAILDLHPPNLIHNSEFFKKPSKAIKASQIHHKWCRREISNFEYLMKLNKFAGRSFNDLTQYPIMPWVITDFESDTLDLNDDKIYRDLSKPIGALDDDRLERFKLRYESLLEDIELAEYDDNEQTPLGVQHAFMYGTHYSSIGIVLYYLLRMEPFTTYNLKFQGGKFDQADRLFHSIKDCWNGCLKSTSDVKELIPEFYYLSEFLVNKQALDLGTATETKEVVNNVMLPPWAKGSPEVFVQLMRKALDSDYVSANLHKWIDLIFGVKQNGNEALKHNNVFHPFTYEGYVDINSIEDPIERRAILKQIDEFGQTPMQLFYKPHKQRLKKSEVLTTIFQAPKVKYYGSYHLTDSRDIGISFLQALYTNFLTIGSDLCLDIHKWVPGKLMIEKKKSNAWSKKFARISKHKKQNRIGSNFSTKIVNRNLCFTCTQDLKYIFACGFEDFSFVVWDVNTNKSVQGIMQHHDVVSCIALSQDVEKHRAILVTGSYDKSVMVWKVNTRTNKYINNVSPSNNKHTRRHSLISNKSSQILFSGSTNTTNRAMFLTENIIDTTPIHILENQLAPVTCVDISLQSGIIVCCSKDGMINLYNSNTGEHYHILQPYVDMAIKEDEKSLLREKRKMEKEIQKRKLQKQQENDDEFYVDSDGEETKDNHLSLTDYIQTSMSNKSNINEISTGSLSICKISSNIGQIICYSSDTRNIFLYSSSGELLSYSTSGNDVYYDIKFSKLGNHILCGGREKIVRVKELPSFITRKKFTDAKQIVRQIYVDKDETCMFVGCSTGDVLVYSLTQKAFVQNRVEILGKLGF